MENLFEQLYKLYTDATGNLAIGYSFDDCKISQMWEILQLLVFMENPHATSEDLVYVADRFAVNPKFM